MKKTLLGIFFPCVIFLSLSFAIAGEISELSKKASKLKLGMTREDVIELIGKPKWAVIPNDKGELALSDPRIKLELYWQNPGCNPVVVQFNGMLKVSGWDEGRAFCGKDAHLFEPSKEYSCKKLDRVKFCKLLLTTPASGSFLVTIVKKANVRAGPGTQFRIVGQTKLGEVNKTPEGIHINSETKWIPLLDSYESHLPYKKWIHAGLVKEFKNYRDALTSTLNYIPLSNYIENLRIYKELLKLEPDNKGYKEMVLFFTGKISEQKISERKQLEAETLAEKKRPEKTRKRHILKSFDYDFRNTRWGISREDVLASEKLKPSENSERGLVYKSRVLDKNVYIFYVFVHDKLVRSKYVLAKRHSNDNLYLVDYRDFKNILTKKYGKPKEDEVLWMRALYKDNPDHWGLALSLGHVVYFSTWETKSTEITCALNGDNFDIQCAVEYCSKELRHLEEKQKRKKAMEIF